jgi:2'-5' RNA ligase
MRAFIAVNLPANVLDSLDAFRMEAAAAVRSKAVRWTDPRQVHLTLRFLGSVPPTAVTDITSALRRAGREFVPFVLRASGLGCFPDLRHPRIFWCGVVGDLEPLRLLHANIQRELASWGRTEERDFHPHLTLARINNDGPDEGRELAAFLEKQSRREFGEWRVESIDLMRSETLPEGARYSCLARVGVGASS